VLPSLSGLDRLALPREYPYGTAERQGNCEMEPIDCVRMVQEQRMFLSVNKLHFLNPEQSFRSDLVRRSRAELDILVSAILPLL
jgi:hypothetical protein